MRHIFETMGTVVSLECMADENLIAAVEQIFAENNERYSLYAPESELSQIAAGTLRLPEASEPLRATYAAALEWRNVTDGIFSPNRPDGVIDLNGIVKAMATAAAGELLRAAGCHDFSLNVGGDIVVSGTQSEGAAWAVGVVEPLDRRALVASIRLTGSRRAIATSGSAERGDHIWLGGSTAPTDFLQATVVADDIVTADVLATVIIAGGRTALDDVTSRWDVDVLTVDRNGGLLATQGIRAALLA